MLEALVLGIVQGLTEFLPISSSGHLALIGHLFGEGLGESLSFVVAVHLGTLAAVCWVFRRDVLNVLMELPALVRPGGWKRSLGREPFRLAVCVLVVSAITGLTGFALRDRIESAFGSLLAVGIAFLCTGILLSLTRLARARDVGVFALGILVGIAQSVALMPGVSRSGTTIGTAMLAGADREFAAKLSFLAAIPAIIGAAVLELGGQRTAALDFGVLVAGFASSLASGFLALRVLLSLIRASRFHLFSYYLWLIGAATIALALCGA